MNPYQPVLDFEREIADYCGSPFAAVVNSCTNALLLSCCYLQVREVTIPKHTYIGVPMSIVHAGGTVKFEDLDWQHTGQYELKPYPIIDSARLCTSDMYKPRTFTCLSLHWGKTFNLGYGGVILHDDPDAQEFFERARADGRKPGVAPKDDNPILGWHCPMSPRDAADALVRLYFLPIDNHPLPPEPNYPDLSQQSPWK